MIIMNRDDIVKYIRTLASQFPESLVGCAVSKVEDMSLSSLIELSDELEEMLLHREAAA